MVPFSVRLQSRWGVLPPASLLLPIFPYFGGENSTEEPLLVLFLSLSDGKLHLTKVVILFVQSDEYSEVCSCSIDKENVDLIIGGTQWLSTGQMEKLNNYLLRNK